ncbi:MAG: Integral membrane protein [uncultured Thermomicrobiales bacterium]|uniref:Integral membrane protein n=1 Tax=uncultured Thermomicrobiales bacterium TaxID=1645740 RepID=A0A6J4V1K6_9BACT|nr:MAG: Integral membrane protein [uncultured Thermomicrobiales bacterium]
MANLSLSPRTLARSSALRPWRTIMAWISFLAIIVFLSSQFAAPTDEDTGAFTNSPDSMVGNELVDAHFPADDRASENLVMHSSTLTVDDPAFRQVVDGTLASLQPWAGDIASVINYYELAASGAPDAASLVSEDRHSLLVPLTFAEDWDAYSARGANFVEKAQAARTSEVQVYAVGDLSGNETYSKIADEDVGKEISVGLPVAGVVLIVVFGALVAAFMPLAIGIVAIVAGSGIVTLLAHVLAVDDATTVVMSMIGLAVGIDYALFFFERFREERRHGALKIDAIERAGGTAGKAVLFSGATVIFALGGLLLMPINIFQAIGISVAVVVVIAVAAALTLLPAFLRLLGDWVNIPRFGIIRKLQRQDRTGVIEFEERRGTGLWGHLANVVMRRPVASLVASVAILIACALPIFTMQLGEASYESLPDTDFKRGYTILARDFDAGLDSPIIVVVDAPAADQTTTASVASLVSTLEGDERFGAVTTSVSDDGQLTRIDAVTHGDPFTKATEALVTQLREETIPGAFGRDTGNVYVTGESAFSVDFNTVLADNLPTVFAFVLGLSFLLLLVAFRSIVVPVKAIILNLLSVGAAYGMVVAVFQHGWGADLFGFTQVESITNWLPVMLFCILFGLSMDYHVFLLSRIRERYDRTHDNDEAVAFGLQSTGRIITGAALIMVAIFGTFAAGRLTDIQQMGFGLGYAVLIDATLIRTVLLPASMKLLGDRNWYLPRWLGWLPDLRVEGDLAPVRLRARDAVPQPAEAGVPAREPGTMSPQGYE